MLTQETDAEKRVSLVGWLERRIEWGSLTLPLYVSRFRMMWREEFGNEDDIPEDIKRKVAERMRANGEVK